MVSGCIGRDKPAFGIVERQLASLPVSRSLDNELSAALRELRHLPSEQIAEELERRFPDRRIPQPRTLRKWRKELFGADATRPGDGTTPWELHAAEAGEAALVTPAWRAAMRYLDAPVVLSRSVAERIATLRTISPALPPLYAWSLALDYARRDADHASLDLYVALELWRDESELERLVSARWLTAPLTAQRVGLEAARESQDPVDQLLYETMRTLAALDVEYPDRRAAPPEVREAALRLANAWTAIAEVGGDEG